MKKVFKTRVNILVAMVMMVFCIFSIKLVQYQIIDGEENFEKSNTSIKFRQNITAARGDIVDCYGVPIASSQPVFNVIFNKAYIQNSQTNNRIMETLWVLDNNGETINDILPLTDTQPYKFIEEKDAEIARMRTTLELNIYATEEDVMKKLTQRYSLEDIPQENRRAVGGVRYTMERDGYSLSYPYTISKNVSMDTVSIISENSRELTGVEIYETSKRYYEDGTVLPHILGTVGPIYAEEYNELKDKGYKMSDVLGKDGLEKSYEDYLKGVDGTVEIERNMYGEIVNKEVIEMPKPGNTLVLTIDSQLQKTANELLKKQMDILHTKESKWGKEASGISLVVLNPKTGAVLAVANYPSYDLNLYSQNYEQYAADENTPLFNRAFQGLYRPGSAFKPVVAVAALQNGLIDVNTRYNCTGRYNYYADSGWFPSCAMGRSHGNINVEEALKVSCNIFFYDLGRRLGIDTINETAHRLGLAVKTGLEIPEKVGTLSSPEQRQAAGGKWEGGDVIQAAIGQSDTVVTTVQLATYAATLANNGSRMSTHMIKSIEDYKGDSTIYTTPITALSQLPDINGSYDVVKQGML
ncbi:MAG: penicillin-binding transpeptidase domain-containing protein, partial [Oscillospiraceae bacterium]